MNTARRYSPEEKNKVVDFVKSFDKTHGRGGKAAAVKKFKLAPMTVGTWVKRYGDKPMQPKSKKKADAPSGRLQCLRRMIDIQLEVRKLQEEFDSLKAAI